MPFLTIAGHTVDVTQANERAPERIGATERAWAGSFLSDVRAEKRAWAFSAIFPSRAAYEAFRADVAAGAIVACSGDALPVATDCLVELGDVEYVEDWAAGKALLFIASLVLRED